VRQWLAGTFAVLVLAAVVGGGVWLLMQRTELDPADEVTPVAEAYAEAWAAWDVDAMAALLADEPADFGPQHTSMVESLAPTGTRITLGEPTLLRAQASFETTVALDLPTGDTWSYITTVVLQRLDGDWQVVWTPATLHPDLRARWRIAAEVEDAFRAPIVDREGRPLSADGDTVTVGVQPSRLGDGVRALQTLRRVLPEAARPLEELLERDDLQPDWFYPLVTIRAEQAAEVRSDLLGLPGVLTRTEEGRVGSDDGFALHTLGRLETVEGLGGQPVEVGAYGLEAAFEDQLTGSAALRVQLLDPEGDLRDTLFTAQDDAPEPLVTTLDLDVQRAIENTLVGLDQPASIVAVDPGTGGILGVAHRPLTGYPRGLEGRFAPGATFGLVTLAALVDAGVGLDAPADCPQTTTVGGVRVEASAAEPDLPEVATVTDAVATACETAIAQLAAELEDGQLEAAAASFGFDVAWELPLDAFTASFPTPADLAERATAAIGQARVEASVVHVASVAAAAVSGTWRAPSLLESDLAGAETRPLGRGVAVAVRTVFEEGGRRTGEPIPGVVFAGVPGTARVQGSGVDAANAWFAGAASGGAGDLDIAFAVLVETGGRGEDAATPLARRFVRELDRLQARG
jgi:cell division protein FtsI/penicillin-binding protein 2